MTYDGATSQHTSVGRKVPCYICGQWHAEFTLCPVPDGVKYRVSSADTPPCPVCGLWHVPDALCSMEPVRTRIEGEWLEEYKPTGGPSKYYDMPFSEWTTTNDMMEYLAEHKWGKYGIHLKDIFKGLCRWGDKKGTDTLYDTKKIIYYGCRILRMLSGKEGVREYLQQLLDDQQFK